MCWHYTIRELEDFKEKYRTDIERYHSNLESFTKSCIDERRMLQTKLTVAEAKLHEINEKCVTQANLQTSDSKSPSAGLWEL